MSFHRVEDQCNGCSCYWYNLDEELQKEVEEQAPGEECTLGQHPWDNSVRCNLFSPMSREG
jgi:hypothetical protein